MIYLDNAATSWPKPPDVAAAMVRYLDEVGANPGRSGHRRSVEAGRTVYRTRAALAALFGLTDPLHVIFAPNATYALNLALRGLLRPGDHVIASSVEHNAVMRPLRALEGEGVVLSVVQCSHEGALDPQEVRRALRPQTRLIVLNHASNVCGTILPVAQVGQIAREAGLLLLVDAAQTAGVLPLAMEEMGVDLLAFTGHKGLLGPTGTGGLAIGSRVPLDRFSPLVRGGTGSRSEHEVQPEFLPDKFESGTLNAVGLAGLLAGLEYLQERGLAAVRAHEAELTRQLLAGLQTIPGVTVYGPADADRQVAVVSFNVAGRTPADIAQSLDETYDIACRPGLHCAPAAHRTLGTFPTGTVRFGLGAFNTAAEVDEAIAAIATLAAHSVDERR
jgi:cysteine desulfurase family protein